MDMEVDNMDTTFLKSWSEVLRRTDPLLWSLAMDSYPLYSCSSASASAAVVAATNSINNHNAIHSEALSPSDLDHRLLPSPSQLLTSSHPGSHSQKHAKGSLAPQTLGIINSQFCRSLLDPHPSHALDWPKCLMITPHGNDENDSENINEMDRNQRRRQHGVTKSRLGALSATTNRPQDFGPVGQVISRRARTVHASQSAASNEFSTGSSAASTTATGIGAGSRPRQLSGNNTATVTTLQSESTGAGFADDGGHHAQGSAAAPAAVVSSAVSDSAAFLATSPTDVVESESLNHAMESSLNVDPVAPPVPITSGSISSNDQQVTPSSSPTATSVSSTPLASSSSSSSSSPSPSTTLTKPPSMLPRSDSMAIILPGPTLDRIHQAVQKGLVRSKDATVAFFYRTFSPTYRISQMYINSWKNGQQRRGIERIQKSVTEGGAFTLVRGATSHMKEVWNQVMAAYKVKAVNAKREAARISAAKAKTKASVAATTSASTITKAAPVGDKDQKAGAKDLRPTANKDTNNSVHGSEKPE